METTMETIFYDPDAALDLKGNLSFCEAREASSEDNSSDSGQKNNFVAGQDITVDTTMQLPPQPAAPGESDDVLNNDGEMQLELKEENKTLLLNQTHLVKENRILKQYLQKKSKEVLSLKKQAEKSRTDYAELLEQKAASEKEKEERIRHLEMVIDQMVSRNADGIRTVVDKQTGCSSDYLQLQGSALDCSFQFKEAAVEGVTVITNSQLSDGMMLQDLLPLMREQESDGHVSNNAATLVTGPRLLTSPVTDVASNSSTDIHVILEKVKKLKERMTEGFAEVAASMEMSPMAEAENEELKALVQNQGETEADISAPATAACGGDSTGQNYELADAESSSSAVEASPSASLSLAAPVNDNLNDCIKCDDTDVMMTKVALAVASCAEIQKAADHLPSVGCVIRGFTVNHLPVYSMGLNGFIANIDKKDVDAFKSCYEPSKKRDRAVAKRFCLHAEVQALNSLPGNVLNATAYTTHSPCLDCAKLLCQRGIVRIFYVFWLNGCETSIKLFKEQDITCMAFPHRDLILRDFSLGFLKNTGINRGGTDTDKPPGECLFFLSSKDRKQK